MIGTSLSDRYQVTAVLGRGGMGVVYRAEDPFLHREVAVKVLTSGVLSAPAEDRFKREARLVAQMDHPAIVAIYDIGRHANSLFYVMPVVQGSTVKSLVNQGALDLGEILEVIAQVAEALDYAHQRGVIHRDVKPENIMVSHEDSRLRARVMDFGLAIGSTGSRLTHSGSLPGTLAYLSPEQILSLEVDGRTDLYSLGTVLYECLVGETPFSGSRYTMLYRIVHDAPARPGRRGVASELERIILSCLAKEPEKRPARGNDLAAELRRFAAGLGDEERLSSATAAVRVRERNATRDVLLLPVVGRRLELELLDERLEKALAGECQLALVGGDAGMGKTRLLREIEEMAKSQGVRVLQGRFSEHESAFPFQGFGELIQDYFRGRDAGPGSSGGEEGAPVVDLRDLLGDLQVLFPVLTEISLLRSESDVRPLELRAEALRSRDRTHVFELLARTLGRLAGGEPTVFLLEHLHGAEDSIDALQYVVRRLGPTPTLIVGTYRQSEISRRHPLRRLLQAMAEDPCFSSIVLGPLTSTEHQQLVIAFLESRRLLERGQRLGRELREKLYEATEGNPFFTQELLQSLADSGGMAQDPATGVWSFSGQGSLMVDALPETIQQAVESRLDRLPEEQLEVLSTASVLGRSFDYHDLEALIDRTDVDEAVDRLIREGILDEDRQARGDLLHFSSGVVRDVLYGKLSRRRRRSYHRRHAEHLEQRFAGRAERVYPQLVDHFAAADVPKKTVEYALLLARSSLDTFGAEAAVRSTRMALELVEEEEVDRAAEGELRYLLANALRVAGAIESAFKEAARAAQALNSNGDPGGAAAAALVAAEISWQVRKTGDTRRWVEKGIELARSAMGETSSGREVPVTLDAAELARARQTLRKLLLLCATTANLRGEQLRARACQEEADELRQAETAGEAEPPPGGTLVTTLLQPLTTLDPSSFETVEDCEVLGNVFETLLRFDAEGNLVSGLADTWETSEDGLTVEVVLEREARFANGRPLVAADVKASLERSAFGSDTPTSACAVLQGVELFCHGEAAEIRGIETLDEHTLRFRLKEPLAIFPALLSDLGTAIRLDEDNGLIGTGPFRIAKLDRERVVLEKNPGYWRGSPAVLDQIDFRMSLDASGIAAGLRMGEIDVGCDLLPDDIDRLLRDSRFRTGLVESTQKNTYFVYWNARGPLAQNGAVRRALSGVVRTRDLVWRTMGRLAQPATCIIPPGILGHDPGRRPLSLGREQAAALLRSTGLGLPLRLVAAIHPLFFDRYSSLLMALIDEWAAIGAEVAIETTSMEDYLKRWQDNEEIDLLIGRWVPDYDDPDSVIYTLYHSRHGHLGRGLESAAADILMEKARHENRAGVRQSLYRKVETLLAEQCAVLPLFHGIDYRMVSPQVRGLRFLGRPPYLSYAGIGKLPKESERVTVGSAEVVPIRVGLPSRLDTLDPAAAVFAEHAEVTPIVFETLTQVGESARIVPGLATEFRSENGARRFHFRLRKNVRFHDGRKLTARDVRHTFERLARHSQLPPDPAVLAIRGVEAFRDGDAAEIEGLLLPSSHEVTIELKEPLTFYPAMLSRQVLGIVPEGTESVDGCSWRDGCVGTGPFRLLNLVPGERIELESNPHYWRQGYPRASHLVFELGVGSEREVEDFRSGRLSLISHLRPRDAEKLRRETRHAANYCESPGLSTYFVALNTRQGPFADPDLRRSFVDAFDLDGMIRATLGRTAVLARGLIPPGLLGHEAVPEGVAPPLRSQKANLRGLELRIAAHPVFEGIQAAFWQLLLRNASALGLQLRVHFLSRDELSGGVEAEDADAFATRWFAGYPDPGSFYSLFHTDAGACGRLCGCEELDRLIKKGSAQSDAGLRHTIYRELEQIFAREALVKPFFHEQVYRFYRQEITDVRIRFGHPEVAYEELRLNV